MKSGILLFAFLLISFALGQAADIPKTINYQGLLTDQITGDPLTGTVDLTFKIYNCESCTGAGDILWTESHTTVVIDNGLFNVILGSNNPIADTVFNKAARWLGITVNTDPEILPRTEFTSVAYSYRALTADSLSENIYLKEDGDTLTGTLFLNGGGGAGGYLQVGPDAANLVLSTNDEAKSRIYGDLYGEIILYDGDGTVTANVNAHNSTGGELKLFDSDGTKEIELYAGASTNDLMVNLPENAINADEILDESGIASDYSDPSPILDSIYFTDIQTVSITIPAPGYIFLIGNCYLRMHNDTAAENGAYIQISEEGGGIVPNYSGTLFTCPIASYDSYYRTPVTVNKVYYKDSPGTYEFRMEGRQYMWSSTETVANLGKLTALYFPTSYAAVKTIVDDPGDNPEAIPIEITDEDGNPTGETKYEVDLRYYELKAKEAQLQENAARINALEAELELERARDRVNGE